MHEEKPRNGVWQEMRVTEMAQEPALLTISCPHGVPLTKILAGRQDLAPEDPLAWIEQALPADSIRRLRNHCCAQCAAET
jgi:hypothetical protein